MLQLQTKVTIPSPNFSINHKDKTLLLGSCFITNIGKRLETNKFSALTNPFGVLYNPASIAQSLMLLLEKKKFETEELNYANDLWYSFYHHSSHSHSDKNTCLENINQNLAIAAEQLSNCAHLFITLGSAWAFKHKKTGEIVANCHKLPASNFTRIYLDPQEIVNKLSEPLKILTSLNPNINIVFTISPIRHWADGAIENMRSKSALHLAIKELEDHFSNTYYFPVYEIFMDELRDYRFYNSDMLHPSDFAIEYIWNSFNNTFFNSQTQALFKELGKILKSFNHRPINSETTIHKEFVIKLIQRTKLLVSKHPHLDFTKEIEGIQ